MGTRETVATTTIRDDEMAIEYAIEKSNHYIFIDRQYILYNEMLGILRILRMYIHEDMSGFCIVPINYEDELYGQMWVIVYGGTSIELLCTDASIELSVAELLKIARFVTKQVGKV